MHTAKSLRAKRLILYFLFITKKLQKIYIYIVACILALITSLLKSWELGQYFKKIKKNILFCFMSGIMNLYVKCIPDIKKVVLYRH